jgi:ATP-dependent helicase/nuclease subunit A
VQVLFPPGADRWAVKLKKDLQTEEFATAQPVDEQMDAHERLRLLYVAATRARDHLIVSVHRVQGSNGNTAAGLFYDKGWRPDLVDDLDFSLNECELIQIEPPFAPVAVAVSAFDEWEAELELARADASRPTAISATKLAELAEAERLAGLQKEPRDIDLPPWQKGRYGSAIGRAVHGVMQTIDLATGDGLKELCAAQAAAEGVLGKEGVIEALCRSALSSDVVQRAAVRPHWREVYVGVPHDEYGVLEGYIDLLYRDDDGLVIVDYKTDAWTTEAELDAKVERYAVQLAAYLNGLGQVTSENVVGGRLLFLARDSSSVTRRIDEHDFLRPTVASHEHGSAPC